MAGKFIPVHTKTERRKIASQALRYGHYRDGIKLWVKCPLCQIKVDTEIGYVRNKAGAMRRETPDGALRRAVEWHLESDHEPPELPAKPPAKLSAKKLRELRWTDFLPRRGADIPKHPEPTPLYELTDPSSATYQERRLGVGAREDLRPPKNLFVSDLGIRSVPTPVGLPYGVVFYQAVDAHQGYSQAEGWLLANGFGAARSWHYTALGEPEYFRDGEGHVVHRWLRLFMRGPERGSLVVWRG